MFLSLLVLVHGFEFCWVFFQYKARLSNVLLANAEPWKLLLARENSFNKNYENLNTLQSEIKISMSNVFVLTLFKKASKKDRLTQRSEVTDAY